MERKPANNKNNSKGQGYQYVKKESSSNSNNKNPEETYKKDSRNFKDSDQDYFYKKQPVQGNSSSSRPNEQLPRENFQAQNKTDMKSMTYNKKDNKMAHKDPKEDHDEPAPQYSKLSEKLKTLYEWYMSEDRNAREADGKVAELRTWIEDYFANVKGGKSDIKCNMRPLVVKEICENINLKYQKDWDKYAQKWQVLLETLERREIHPVVAIGFFLAIDSFKLYFNKNQNYQKLVDKMKHIGARGWWGVSIENIERYVSSFEVGKLTAPEDIAFVCKEIDRLISRQNAKAATTMILAFDMMHKYNPRELITQLIKQDYSDEAAKIIGKDVDLARHYVNELNPNKDSSKAREIIKRFNFNPYDFKHVVRSQSFLAIRSLVKRLDWMRAEEIVQSYTKQEMSQLVDILIKDNLIKEAFGVVQRNSLEYNRDLSRQTSSRLSQTQGLKPASNRLLVEDDFCPTEVYLNGEPLESYLTLGYFGVKEQDIKFVDKEGPLFDQVCEELLKSDRIGIDSEFASDLIGYEESKIAIMQLASRSIVAVFDFLKLEQSDKLYQFCQKLFADPKIEKLGHTFTSDIKCFKASFKGKPLEFNNVINIDEAFKEGTTKFGLAAIVKKVFNKEFSKYNQQSNWRKRPLRRSQLHYASLDAVATLQCLEQIEKTKDERVKQVKHENYSSTQVENKEPKLDKRNVVVQNEDKLKTYKETKHYKFLVDATTKKLATNLRNLGLDTAWVDETLKPTQIVQLAEQEERIILSRDSKLITCKKTQPLIRLISSDPFTQLKQIISTLDIKVSKKDLLSRCVKCNSGELQIIGAEEAMKTLQWENTEESLIKEFWKCPSCNQIYWEGGTFDRAQKMFSQLINDTEVVGQQAPALAVDKDQDEEDESSDNSVEHQRQKQFKEFEEMGITEADDDPVEES